MMPSRHQELTIAILLGLLTGCGQNQQKENGMFKHQSDTEVTSLPEYNFQSFSGTVWKTKVKTALANIKTYKSESEITLLTPQSYDRSHPEFQTPPGLENVIAELPIGTVLRIERLMKDNGNWGGMQVTVSLIGDTSAVLENDKTIYLSRFLIEKNKYLWGAWSKSTDWAGAPDILEKVK